MLSPPSHSQLECRAAAALGLVIAAVCLSAGIARADTVRGQVTRCGEPVTGVNVSVFVTVEEGFPAPTKPCVVSTRKIRVGEDLVNAEGSYFLTFVRPQRDEDHCRFVLKGASVEFRDAVSGALIGRSAVRAFSGTNTTFTFNLAIDCPPPPPPGGDPMTVRGTLLLCGQSAAGFEVRAVTEVRVGFDRSDVGGKPCELSSPNRRVAGTTTVSGDGSFTIRFDRPIDPAPETSCDFRATVFIQLVDPATGGTIWISTSKPISTTVTFDQDICRFFVAVSVKVVLDSAGRRPSSGDYTTNAQIERAVSQANTVLALNDAGWRLFLDEIVDVQQSQYFRIDSPARKQALEDDARAHPDDFRWRADAVNFYVVDDLLNGGNRIGGSCSFPTDHEIIVINNRGILNGGVGWLHEVGHFLSLMHTFECLAPDCQQSTCSGMGAAHGSTIVSCPDNCPHDENVMSYNSFDVSDARFSACQIREMAFELFDPAGSREHVLRRVLPTGAVLPRILPDLPAFLRGDSNGSGVVDISDGVNTLGVLFSGIGLIACPDAADANDDGLLDVSDAVATLSTLFLGNDLIGVPGPLHCSPDGTEDDLAPCSYNEIGCPRSSADP